MNCDECQEILSAHQDGEAAEAEWMAAEHHAAGCEACRDYRGAIRRLSASLRRWPDEEPGGPALRHASTRLPGAPVSPWRWLSLAAGLILVAGMGFLAGRMSQTAKIESASPAGSVGIEERIIYPETNEIRTKAALPELDTARLRLR